MSLSQRAPKNGWVFIFLSNESDEPVYFDNLAVVQEHGRIVQENHYYPFGQKIAGISSQAFNKLTSNYNYQGEYAEGEEETGWDEFYLRMYDPQIARWGGSDPYDQFASPFMGMGNDPINNVDPSGGASGGGPLIWPHFSNPWWNFGNKLIGSVLNSVTSLSQGESEPVVIYSDYYSQSIYTQVERFYDGVTYNDQMTFMKDLAYTIFNNNELGKKILDLIPSQPGFPTAMEMAKAITTGIYGKVDGENLFNATESIVKAHDKPLDLLANGLGMALGANVTLFYSTLKLMVNDRVRQINLDIFDIIESQRKNEGAFNAYFEGLRYGNMIKGDYVGFITVTKDQFYDIMHDKFFVPKDYKTILVNRRNLESERVNTFKGEKPGFYIYFNKMADKGYLHISECGVMPIFPRNKQY